MQETTPRPPVTERRPHVDVRHGEKVSDPYHWLRDREDPAVLKHLEAENAYADAVLAPTTDLQAQLYDEMVARLKEDDETVPVRKKDYLYYSRTEKGRQYRIFCRKRNEEDAERIILDANALAEGESYFSLGALELSPDQRLLAYSVDTDGAEKFTVKVLDLETNQLLPDRVEETYYGLEWGNDNRTLYYTRLDDAHRPYRLYRHRLGEDVAQDRLVMEEPDERFFMKAYKTKSERFLLIHMESNTRSEVWLLDADDPEGEPQRIAERRPGIEYGVDHAGDHLYVVTNEDAVNFRLMRTPVERPGREHWTEVIPHDPAVKLEGVEAFQGHLVVNLRRDGLTGLRIVPLDGSAARDLQFDEAVYQVHSTHEQEYTCSQVRFVYTSLTTPRTVYDEDLTSGQRILRKQEPVLGGYDPDLYHGERLMAQAEDGTDVPVSLVYRKDRRRPEGNPTLLYGYGSYGISVDPGFDSKRVSLLDRGFVFAIAHIRGGGDLGRPWYDAGKLMHKRNTFGDFIAAARHLLDQGVTAPGRLAIRGGSAGGLLVGAVANERPDLFRAVIAKVPFVDVINTMCDPSLPLTVIEWEEWGDPRQKEAFDYMRSYSPYDNVREATYPEMLVFGGLNDPRVAYWEPAKWVARLRDRQQGDAPILLKTDLGAGHAGPSGRYDFLRETALEYAFLIDRLTG